MRADFRFANGITGRMTCSLLSRTLLRIEARVTGDQGELRVTNFVLPHMFHRVSVRTAHGSRTEHIQGEATYTYQLRAFAQAIAGNTPVLTGPADAIATMRVIDAVYQQAGLQRRGNDAQ